MHDADVALEPESEAALTKVQLMEGILKAAHDWAQEQGVGFLVTIQPAAKDLTMNFVFGNEDLAKYPGYDPARLTGIVAEICARNGIPYVNLFDAFAANNPEELYFRHRNPHWNAAGQALGAQVVTPYVLQALQ